MGEWDDIDDATPFDRSGLIAKSIHSRSDLFAAEARNIAKATKRYFASRPSRRRAPFTFEWAFRLHKEMFGDVWEWAGERRKWDLNLESPHHRIDSDLYELFKDLEYWQAHGTYSLLERAVRLHHGAVKIHPFQNGNGRWARMLGNIFLRQNDHPVTEWPDGTLGRTSVIRAEYIAAVRAADDWDFGPLLGLQRRFTAEKKEGSAGGLPRRPLE
jgi:Fic-DOC domain mobile mystery protein B